MWLKSLVWWRSALQIDSTYIAGCNSQNWRKCIKCNFPKMKILHPQVEEKIEDILKNVTKQLMVPSWDYGSQWGPLIVWLPYLEQNCSGQLLVSHFIQCERFALLCTYTSSLLRVFMCGFGNLQRCRYELCVTNRIWLDFSWMFIQTFIGRS